MKERAKEPYLIVLDSSAEAPIQRYLLAEGETTVGRSRDSDICLTDRTISRSHCTLERRGDEVRVFDVSTKNPSWIGDGPGDDRVLRHGDILRLGSCRLEFHGKRRTAPRGAARGEFVLRKRRSLALPMAIVTAAALAGVVFGWLALRDDNSASDGSGRLAVATPEASPTRAPEVVPPAKRVGAGGLPARRAEVAPEPLSAEPVVAVAREEEVAVVKAADTAGPRATKSSTAEEVVSARDVPKPSEFTFYDTHVVPYLRKYCTSCHGEKRQKGDLSLEKWKDEQEAVADKKTWRAVAQMLRKGEMPPSTKKQPVISETSSLVSWVDMEVLKINVGGKPDPGRVTMRRLNSYEYNYTVRDLTGLDLKLADGFPADDIGYGFDNIGDVLSMPPLLLEKYLAAAGKIARAVMKNDEARKRVMICTPTKRTEIRTCAKKIITQFGSKAYRRPLKTTETSRLVKLVDLAIKNDDDFSIGIELALQAILVSPYFLFRVELDAKPNDSTAVRPIDNYELASRLSYFLWSSLPDEGLSDLARKGRLKSSKTLEAQVKRMLHDPKARGLIKTFSALWLGSRTMKTVSPDPDVYPSFDEDLRSAMRRETELFFEEIMRKDLSVLLFLDADFTFLNERLAGHYGISGVRGDDFRRTSLSGERRGGVLTQGSVLTITSNPTRTSPVARGKWVLEQILGTPPPPPPPGADSFTEETEGADLLSLRQKMELHRRDPNCTVCHAKMDALGLAFENYDGVGAWREYDGEGKIDPSGKLPDGRSFGGAAELKKILLEQQDSFCRCLTEKMLTFALGRGLEYSDTPVVERIARSLAKNDYRFSALVLGIVQSEPFQQRRGERAAP